jgi:hypothetical protein
MRHWPVGKGGGAVRGLAKVETCRSLEYTMLALGYGVQDTVALGDQAMALGTVIFGMNKNKRVGTGA